MPDATGRGPARLIRALLIWSAVATACFLPVLLAAFSPLLQWRQPVYIAAGFAGITGLCLLLLQPLLAGGLLPGFNRLRGRKLHRWTGAFLVAAVILHVAGLWITSPPDVIDVLLFRSPTPFSLWGVIAMWAVFLAALLAVFRRRLPVGPRVWRRAHAALALTVVLGTVVHAMLIEGTMEPVTKALLCTAVIGVTLKVMLDLGIVSGRRS